MVESASLTDEEYLQAVKSAQTALIAEVKKFGLDDMPSRIEAELSNQEWRTDPFDGSQGLYGEWRDERGQKLGNILVNGGGQVFAEFDVLCPHPTKSKWFIEAVTAWGPATNVKAELRLLPALAD